MKLYKTMLAALTFALAGVTLTGCNEDEAVAPLQIPESNWKANTTIADFKAKYWQDGDNYYTEVGTTAEGEHVVLAGRVIANDISGNIYQNVVLQDSTAAVCIAVSMSDMNVKYKIGEEMLIDVTGLYAGKYAGLFQIGKDDVYTSGSTSTPQVGKMTEEQFTTHVQLNGLPHPEKVNVLTTTIENLVKNQTNKDSVLKYQSQLVRLNGVSFQGGGVTLWGERGTSHNTRYLFDESKQMIAVDNSGMSDFNDQVLPAGHGDIIAVASYYRTAYQLVFVNNTSEYVFDFGGESYAPAPLISEGNGSAETPYNVGAVVNGDASGTGWVTGYIVGWIDGMSMSDGANFTVPASSNSNMLLAPTVDETYVGNCIPVQLNGDVRSALNLQDNPGNLGKQVSIKGSFERYFGSNGLKSPAAYAWGDKGDDSAVVEPEPTGTGTFKKVTAVTSGKQYLIVAEGKMATVNTANFGYLKVVDATIANDQITTDVANAFTITSATGGYNIAMSDGRYLYQTGDFNSFNFTASVTADCLFTIEAQSDGTFKITATSVGKWMQYDTQYGSYGSYPDQRGVLPSLYEKVD